MTASLITVTDARTTDVERVRWTPRDRQLARQRARRTGRQALPQTIAEALAEVEGLELFDYRARG